MDNAATTRIQPEALDTYIKTSSECFGNASSIHKTGMDSAKVLDEARSTIAKTLGCKPREVIFTSGGTESNNMALRGYEEKVKNKRHIITTNIEHHSVLNTCRHLKSRGHDITFLEVDSDGRVNPDDVAKAIREDTILVSVMFANNEIGTIQPIKEIGKICRDNNVLFHTDAVQAYGHLPIDVNEMHIDLLSASGHKFGGPKGVGFLYVRDGLYFSPLMYGGSQEYHLRPGTENIPGIAAMARAAEIACDNFNLRYVFNIEKSLRDYFIRKLLEIDGTKINGSIKHRLSNNINVTFKGIEAESLLMYLDNHGICCSASSACTSRSLKASHVLTAIGLTDDEAHSTLRFSLSNANTIEEIDYVVEYIKKWKEICNE